VRCVCRCFVCVVRMVLCPRLGISAAGAPAPSPPQLSSPFRACFASAVHAVQVGRHPYADSLYLEEIDLGEGQPRQVRRA
jgi:hypothetical protein